MKKRYTLSKDGEILYDKIQTVKDPVAKLNQLEEYRQKKNLEISRLREIIELQYDVICGIESYLKLKYIREE